MNTRNLKETPTFLKRFEVLLLVIILCVLAVRSVYVESPHTGLFNPEQALTNEAFSVLITSVLVFAVVAWFLVALSSRRFVYRFSGIEIGAVLFLVAGAAGVFVASNKRAALTDTATLMAPMLMAVILVQILDSLSKIRIVLFVVMALGAVATLQCIEQSLEGNEEMIAYYEEDPEARLREIGAEVGSFEHMLYERRVYSKDIRGFLTTSNSTGSFLLLCAFASLGLFVDAFKDRKDPRSYPATVCICLTSAISIAGVVITRSRGALGAGFLCTMVFVVVLILGAVLHKHRRLLLIFVIIAVVSAALAIISYGLSHGTLPGGASMLVRWQYWDGAVRMYADQPLTGVGGGNFSSYYPHYKIAAAPETVSDPHNFVLNLLSQYGPLGLIGYIAAFAAILIRTVFSAQNQLESAPKCTAKARPWATLCAISLALLVFRPVLIACPLGDQPVVMVSAFIILYVIPVVVFGVVFWLLQASLSGRQDRVVQPGRATTIGLFCGMTAVGIHNLIDFAIFEPGVLTLFWTVAACLYALDCHQKNRLARQFEPPRLLRISAIAATAFFAVAGLNFVLSPTVNAGSKIQRALREPKIAHDLLDRAAAADLLAPAPLSLGGKAYLTHYDEVANPPTNLLQSAAERFDAAIRRDPANFKNYRNLARAYAMLAENAALPEKKDYRQKALQQLQRAVERYPGSDKLNFELAELADLMNAREIAMTHYQAAVEIEDGYREQFRIMYPGREMFSRLGERKYLFAKERIKKLRRE